MRSSLQSFTWLFAVTTVAALSGCGSTSLADDAGHDAGLSIDAGQTTLPVQVAFAFKVNGRSFSCADTYQDVGTSGDAGARTFRGSYARFYAFAFRLIDSSNAEVPLSLTDDGVWQLADSGVVEIDGENGGTCEGASGNLKVIGNVPTGTYHGLKFKVGLPSVLNHLLVDAQPSPLNQSAMFWSWTSGYRFLRIEGFDATKKSLPGGLLHLGSTGCTLNDTNDPTKGATCTYPNEVDVSLPTFDTAKNTVVLDLGTLFSGSDLAVNAGGATGCMSALTDPECPSFFKQLGLPYSTGREADGGLIIVTPASQSLFTFE